LNKIEPDDQQIAKSILQWVVWVARPLHVRELAVAVAALPDHTSLASMNGDIEFSFESQINRIFGSLIKIENWIDHLKKLSEEVQLCSQNLSLCERAAKYPHTLQPGYYCKLIFLRHLAQSDLSSLEITVTVGYTGFVNYLIGSVPVTNA
jgi:hypothetical protein